MILGTQDNGKRLEVKAGDEVVVRLPENASTGYQWSVRSASGLSQVSDDFEMGGSGAGAGGMRVLKFRVQAAGQHALRLVHMKEWLGEESAEDAFAVTVVAQ